MTRTNLERIVGAHITTTLNNKIANTDQKICTAVYELLQEEAQCLKAMVLKNNQEIELRNK